MAKLSIDVTAKIRSGLFLLSALLVQGPVVAGLVTDKLRANLKEGEEPPPFLAQIQGLAQILKAALDLMVELDNLSVDENRQRAAMFNDREDKITDLGRYVSGVRRIVTGHYVDPDLERLGLVGDTAREAIALLRQSKVICEQLRGDGLSDLLGDSFFEPPLDLPPYEPQIQPTIAALREAFDVHQQARRRVDELLSRKKKSVAEYETVFIRTARQFEDMCRLAGLADLADKVRPSQTRRGETAVELEPPADGDDSPAPAEEAPASEPESGPGPVTGTEPAA